MKQIKNAEYEEFQKYLHDKNNGRILTPDGLRFICQTNDYNPEKIGRHMLEMMARQQSQQWLQNKEGYMAMEYTPIEKQALDMMKRTDFKNLSKTDVLSIASKLSELRPDVAKEVIAQFPEFVKLIQSSMSEYKDILGNIILSDNESIKQVYATADKELDISADSRKQFYDFAEKVHADLSKCLDNPELSAEE